MRKEETLEKRGAKGKKCSYRGKNYNSFTALSTFLGTPPNYVGYGKIIGGGKVGTFLTEVNLSKSMTMELISHYAKKNKVILAEMKLNKQMIRKLLKCLETTKNQL